MEPKDLTPVAVIPTFDLDPKQVEIALLSTRVYLQGRGAEENEARIILASLAPESRGRFQKTLLERDSSREVKKKHNWAGHEVPQTLLTLQSISQSWKTSDDFLATWRSSLVKKGSRASCMNEALTFMGGILGIQVGISKDELHTMRQAASRGATRSERMLYVMQFDRDTLSTAIRDVYTANKSADMKAVPKEDRRLFQILADYRIALDHYVRYYSPGSADALGDMATITRQHLVHAKDEDKREREQGIATSPPNRNEAIIMKAATQFFQKLGVNFDPQQEPFAPFADTESFERAFKAALRRAKDFNVSKHMEPDTKQRLYRTLQGMAHAYNPAFHPGLFLLNKFRGVNEDASQKGLASIVFSLTLNDLGSHQLKYFAQEHFNLRLTLRDADPHSPKR